MSNRRPVKLTATRQAARIDAVDESGLSRAAHYGTPTSESDLARLTRTIEGEIVPRLLMSLTMAKRAAQSHESVGNRPTTDEIAEFARLLLAHEHGVANAYVQIMRHRGTALDCICTELLAPAAWRLGELWERDQCGFAELITGLTRLASVVREVSAARAEFT
jgi:hypothetical protein